jgi:hypothetical protein
MFCSFGEEEGEGEAEHEKKETAIQDEQQPGSMFL